MGDQGERQGRGRDDALHSAFGAIPKQEQIARSGVDDIDAARKQRVGLRAAAAEGDPFGRDVRQTERRGVLLDQLLLLDDVRRQVDDTRLARDGDLGFFLAVTACPKASSPAMAAAAAPARFKYWFMAFPLNASLGERMEVESAVRDRGRTRT